LTIDKYKKCKSCQDHCSRQNGCNFFKLGHSFLPLPYSYVVNLIKKWQEIHD
jgi:hypothetical protein